MKFKVLSVMALVFATSSTMAALPSSVQKSTIPPYPLIDYANATITAKNGLKKVPVGFDLWSESVLNPYFPGVAFTYTCYKISGVVTYPAKVPYQLPGWCVRTYPNYSPFGGNFGMP